jgi:hypothetical protein
MKTSRVIPRLVLASLAAASTAVPQDAGDASRARFLLEEPQQPQLNRVGLSYRAGFNIKASFKNLGGFTAGSVPQTTPDGDTYNYDDGYNLTDSSGNALGLTTYFGYQNAGQIQGGGTQLVLSRSSAAGNASSKDVSDDPHHGVELTYAREIRRGDNYRWGVEGALNWLPVGISDRRALNGSVTTLRDAFTIPFQPMTMTPITLPAAPYEGPFLGNMSTPSIGATPTPLAPITTAGASAISGRREMDADVFGLRLGPYVEFPLGERCAVSLSGGLAVLAVNSDFSFRESVTVGASTVNSRGAGSDSDVLVGGYVGAQFTYALNDRWGLFAGAQFQGAGKFSQKVGGRKAELDFGQSIFVTLGASYSF